MRRRTGWLLAGGLIALAIGGFALRRGGAPLPAQADAASVGADTAAHHAATTPADPVAAAPEPEKRAPRAAGTGTTAVPTLGATSLPPPDAPLAGILDALEARARRGDVQAACRLAADLSRCSSLPRRRASQVARGNWQVPSDPKVVEQMIDASARVELALEQDERMCAGVDATRSRQATAWLLAAAQGGHLPSMAAFIGGSWMMDPTVVHHPEVVAAFAREAGSMARRVAESGEPSAIHLLATAFAGEPPYPMPLAEVLQPDPVLARALFGVAMGERAVDAPTPVRPGAPGSPRFDPFRARFEQFDATLTPQQRDAAKVLQDTLQARVASARAAAAHARMPRSMSVQFIDPAGCDR